MIMLVCRRNLLQFINDVGFSLCNIFFKDVIIAFLTFTVTWNATCTYSKFLASKNPSCCVSFSSFYSSKITPCPACACGCQNNNTCIM